MENGEKRKILSKPQRNRRVISNRYFSDESSNSIINSEEQISDASNESNESNEKEKVLSKEEQINVQKKFSTKKYNYKYLNHTADVILQGLGNSWKQCFESIGVSMFNYMSDLKKVENKMKKKIVVIGEDMNDLLFNFLTEFHFLYGSEYYICKHIEIINFDEINFQITAFGYGDIFDSSIHDMGTEIKAITKHGLRTNVTKGQYEVFVLVDI